MSRYSRLRVVLETASNASYANPAAQSLEYEKTYDEGLTAFDVEAAAAGTTLALAPWTTVYGLLVEVLGTTAATYVSVGHQNAAGVAVVAKVPITGEGFPVYFTPDVDPAADLTLTSSAGDIPCRVTILGT